MLLLRRGSLRARIFWNLYVFFSKFVGMLHHLLCCCSLLVHHNLAQHLHFLPHQHEQSYAWWRRPPPASIFERARQRSVKLQEWWRHEIGSAYVNVSTDAAVGMHHYNGLLQHRILQNRAKYNWFKGIHNGIEWFKLSNPFSQARRTIFLFEALLEHSCVHLEHQIDLAHRNGRKALPVEKFRTFSRRD
jgi:hypothetical protein